MSFLFYLPFDTAAIKQVLQCCNTNTVIELGLDKNISFRVPVTQHLNV